MSLPSSTNSEKPPRWSASATITPSAPRPGHDEIGADRVRVVVDPRDHARQHVLDVAAELEPRLLGKRRQDAEEGRKGRQQRQHLVPLGLFPEEILELLDLLRMCSAARSCAWLKVVGQVVAARRIAVRVPDAGRDGFRASGVSTHGIRAVFIASHQPSLYIARLPMVSKYCWVWCSGGAGR